MSKGWQKAGSGPGVGRKGVTCFYPRWAAVQNDRGWGVRGRGVGSRGNGQGAEGRWVARSFDATQPCLYRRRVFVGLRGGRYASRTAGRCWRGCLAPLQARACISMRLCVHVCVPPPSAPPPCCGVCACLPPALAGTLTVAGCTWRHAGCALSAVLPGGVPVPAGRRPAGALRHVLQFLGLASGRYSSCRQTGSQVGAGCSASWV